jgi:tRNA (cmo5U34)-methyltransferase
MLAHIAGIPDGPRTRESNGLRPLRGSPLMSNGGRDELFAEPRALIEPFRFDAQVASVFADMVGRSVPGYRELVELTALVGARFVRPGTRAYDLGCSLGAVSVALLASTPGVACDIVAVDKAPAMVDAFGRRLSGVPQAGRIRPVCADLESVSIADASLVVLNLTLQFIPPDRRPDLLCRIRAGLVPGGALVLSEKTRPEDPAEQALLTALHEDFKRARGYSELEISQKRAALERVLIPDTPEQHLERLRAAGFPRVVRWFQCLNFVSFLAWI